jgi:hypothetical protein
MIKQTQIFLMLSMLLLSIHTFGQSTTTDKNADKATATYLDLMINLESTNLNYGSSNESLADYKKSVKGIQAGISFQAGITPGFSLVSELYFMKKGGKLTSNNPLSDNELTLRFYTIELPVLARFHVGNFYMNAGPSIAYNIGGSNKIANYTTDISFKNSTEGFRRLEAGIQAGAGYMFPFKHKRLALDLRYNYGLTNISRSSEIYNRSFIVSVHFSKPWKKNPLARN